MVALDIRRVTYGAERPVAQVTVQADNVAVDRLLVVPKFFIDVEIAAREAIVPNVTIWQTDSYERQLINSPSIGVRRMTTSARPKVQFPL